MAPSRTMLVSFARKVRPIAAPAAYSHAGLPLVRKASEQDQRERREERHRPVEKDLAGDDHVVGHQRHQQGREQPCAAAVEQPAELVDQVDGRHAHGGRGEALEPVWEVEPKAERQNGLEEQRVRSEDGEEVGSSSGSSAIAAAWPE